jgi:hypothetical protein
VDTGMRIITEEDRVEVRHLLKQYKYSIEVEERLERNMRKDENRK